MADGKPSRKSREKAPQDRSEVGRSEAGRGDPYANAFAAAIGGIVRTSRAKRGMTRRQLAEQSGTSERYLAQIEGGQGNPSVIVLHVTEGNADRFIVSGMSTVMVEAAGTWISSLYFPSAAFCPFNLSL